MGQKVNPHGLRVGVIKNWDSRWYASDEKFGDTLVSDYKVREYLKKKLRIWQPRLWHSEKCSVFRSGLYSDKRCKRKREIHSRYTSVYSSVYVFGQNGISLDRSSRFLKYPTFITGRSLHS